MKRIFLSFFVLSLSFIVYAQHVGDFLIEKLPGLKTRTELFTFLKDEGFKVDTDSTFIGVGKYQNFGIFFNADKNDKLIACGAFVPVLEESWTELELTLIHFKNIYKNQYGSAVENIELFNTEEQPETDEDKLNALKNDMCLYGSAFEIYKGWNGILTMSYSKKFGYGITFAFMNTETSNTDTTNQHMEFMKIPINGRAKDFGEKMKAKGFKLLENNGNDVTLEGRFAGQDDCRITAFENNRTNNLYAVFVEFSHEKDWGGIMSLYSRLKDMLKEKYGEPHSEKGDYSFDNPPTSPTLELYEIARETKAYQVFYRFKEGAIALSIAAANLSVIMIYTDAQNGQVIRSEAIDDL